MAAKSFMVLIMVALLISVLISISASTPPPPDYQIEEYAWIKEKGTDASNWKQYNDTVSNQLELQYLFSECNLAYVVRTEQDTGAFNVTFLVYHNSSAASGFNSSGHLFPGTTPLWSNTISAQTNQSSGGQTYQLFLSTFDPQGIPGDYQVRINETGPGNGSHWDHPAGNPAVQWMFFKVPEYNSSIYLEDQLGRDEPFYIDGGTQTTHLNITTIISPPGNDTGSSMANVLWLDTQNQVIMNRSSPIYYAGGGKWAVQDRVTINSTFFPYNATHEYRVVVNGTYFSNSTTFKILSRNWVDVEMDVYPTKGQWFDPSSFKVVFRAVINSGMPGNPYQDVSNLTLRLWNHTSEMAVIANLSWNITGYPVVEGSTYTYTWSGMIPTDLFYSPSGEYAGSYELRSVPDPLKYPALIHGEDFYVDDAIECYTSLEKASDAARSAFKEGSTVWLNLEFDPTYLRDRQNENTGFDPPNSTITWNWPTPPPYYLKREEVTGTKNFSWPSGQYWAFSSVNTSGFPDGVYSINATAECRTGYVVWEYKQYEIYQSYSPPVEANPRPPVTRISVRPRTNKTWRNQTTNIKFYPYDPHPGVGVDLIFYQIDGGDTVTLDPRSPSIIQALEGHHTYTYWSQDRAGNTEIPRTVVVRVDTNPPTTTISPSGGPQWHEYPVIIRLSGRDPSPGSGINKTYYSINGSPPVEYPIDGFPALEGDHLYSYWSVDAAGNAESRQEARIKARISEPVLLCLVPLVFFLAFLLKPGPECTRF